MTIRKTQQVHIDSKWNRDKSFIYFAEYSSQPFHLGNGKVSKRDKSILLYRQPIPWKNLAEEHRLKKLEQERLAKANKLACPLPPEDIRWFNSATKIDLSTIDVFSQFDIAPIWHKTGIGYVIIADDENEYPPIIKPYTVYSEAVNKVYKLLIKPNIR